MSIINAILCPHEAVVWSDTKAFNADYRHVGYMSKAVPLPHANTVFWARGSGDAFKEIMGQLHATAGNTFDAIADTFEEVVATAWDEYFAEREWAYNALAEDRDYYQGVFQIEAGAVGYSHRDRKFKGVTLYYSGADDKRRWDWEATTTVLAPGISVPEYVQAWHSMPAKMVEVANLQCAEIAQEAEDSGRVGVGAGGDLQAITMRPNGMHIETFATERDGRFYLLNDTSAQAAQPARKVGRNEPCPCGSGRKAKRCCHG